MNSSIVWMIVGMGIVTYLPRMIPLVFLEKLKLPSFIQGVLKNVPYAILGALIFPGVFFIQNDFWYGLLGAVVAFFIAYTGVNVIFVVIGAILVLTGVSIYF
ncbi:AzlD domain-containing protein [Caldibacillus thermolactis]|jgi:branched-subunit amino acid transport protein|uniref:AzlD domain-containing protein n=1 Tax=Pallidibacillus thermolactis TaxID=251051 RepID=A0ABT2WGY6_9BACI|nr:AzlD domain-containing protein [Pallidibacillus thermolactis]MCU9594948.1 AzlD domain-containing protein [Pallidibacillus thermolactis]MCU9601826.1 AzlD domain-containing protein [Pallidibacillus thermolactis subsp. kokeshiiformis]MED1674062.1 AzlD domain-containing protein [Pallidibacillus thermolactis subsp. kokeshiiformis]